jgi:hypothetical protein
VGFELSGAEARIVDHLEATLESHRVDGASPGARLEIRTDTSPEPFVSKTASSGCAPPGRAK